MGEFQMKGHWNRSLMQKIGIILIVGVSILRFDVGYDYFSYYLSILSGDEKFEPLSQLIFDWGQYMGYPPLSFMIIGLLTYYFVFSTLLKYSSNLFIGVMTYVCLFYLTSFGIIRQTLGAAIIFWGVRYIYQHSFVRYALVCVLASLFHTSSLVGIVIYPIYRYVSLKWVPFIFILIVESYYFVLGKFIEIDIYVGASNRLIEEATEGGGGMYLRYAFILIIVAVFILAWIKRARVDYKLLSVSVVGTIFPFVLGSHYGMRISEYFFIYLCLFIPQVLSYYKTSIRALFIMGLMCFFILVIGAGRNQSRPNFLPYQTIFNIDNIKNPHFRLP